MVPSRNITRRVTTGNNDASQLEQEGACQPSDRDMERACNGRPVTSAMCKVLSRGELPARLEVIVAIITACGGNEQDRERFATAWRRLTMPRREHQSAPGLVRPFREPGEHTTRI